MVIMGIETSCDDTAAAVLDGNTILSNVVSSQTIHKKFGGIVPELASRAHQQYIVPVYREALRDAGLDLADIEGIAVTRGPGLMGSLLVGLSFAQGLAITRKIPFTGINHLEAHLWSAEIEHAGINPPFLSLIVSGGHTILVNVQEFKRYVILGATRDDAAGEAYDKVAKLLGLGYPGGPAIDRLSREGDPHYCKFPVPGPRNSYDFSFSGIKTAVLYYVQSLTGDRVKEETAHICASFQHSVLESLVRKTIAAALSTKLKTITVTGGVAANSRLKEILTQRAGAEGITVFFPSPKFCTDNGAIAANVGLKYFERGMTSSAGIAPVANLQLDE